jgi:hypothetical protein
MKQDVKLQAHRAELPKEEVSFILHPSALPARRGLWNTVRPNRETLTLWVTLYHINSLSSNVNAVLMMTWGSDWTVPPKRYWQGLCLEGAQLKYGFLPEGMYSQDDSFHALNSVSERSRNSQEVA